ncbi:MAG: DUF2490 domain-containing protein [Bacteroidales bacterium]|nr:DUF2490 domain-containing protein [Bacteroidales bacterium]
MRCKIHIVFSFLLLAMTMTSFAQSGRNKDFGAIAGMDYTVEPWDDVELELEEELRFENYGGFHLERWLSEVSVETPVQLPYMGNRLRMGANLGYVRHHDDKGYFDNRLRFGVNFSYSETVRRLKLSYRTRMMFTYRDERTGDYRVNPKWYWRHKFQAVYQMPGSRYKYTLSSEFFLRLREDSSETFIDHLRTTFSVSYRLTRRQSISGFVRMDNELQVKEPFDRFYLGLSYHLKY